MVGAAKSFGTDLGETYRNPPVVEALCEVYFRSTNWDSSSHDSFYREVKEAFPRMEKRSTSPVQTSVGVGRPEIELERALCFTESGDQVIQVSSGFLVFNQLLPYRLFSEWGMSFLRAASKYMEMFAPQVVDRIGVKYINHIEIPGRRITMEDYFTVFPRLPSGSGKAHGSFLVNCIIPQATENHFLTMTFSTMEKSESDVDRQTFKLELFEQALVGRGIGKEELRDLVGIAHRGVTQAFEGSITDNLRILFGKEDPT